VRFFGRFNDKGKPVYGLIEGDTVWAVKGSIFARPEKGRIIGQWGQLKALPPCEPTKILAIGWNYSRPDIEVGVEAPQMFLKPLTALIGNRDPIVYPWMSKRVVYAPELAVVISRKAKDIPVDKAPDFILGYTCANDIAAQDLSQTDRLHTGRPKIFDTFCPLGPVIAMEVDGNDLAICGRLNGQLGPSSHTSKMIRRVEEIVSFASCVTTLLPGDVILLGSPGMGAMYPDDIVEVEIEGIGILRNPVAAQENRPVRWQGS
jgi:2-keto-4-pentenoate hydratase/2-oxohepta-3-ene-1,7-dioic acid hydratase in catechol pathway